MNRPMRLLFPAVAYRDLRARTRYRRSLLVVTLYLSFLGSVAAVYLLQQGDPGDGAPTGRQLFSALAITQLCLTLVVTPASMAGTVSGERQRRSWDLLRVSRLSSFDLVFGKFLAGLFLNLLLLVAPLPIYAVAILSGGVTARDVVLTGMVLLATTLLLASLTLVVSAVSSRPMVALLIANMASLLLGLGLSALVLYLEVVRADAGLAMLGQLGSLPPTTPALSPLAQIDPLAALLSVLPGSNGGSLLGSTGRVAHAFGLAPTLPLWEVFSVLALVATVLFVPLAALAARWSSERVRG